MSKIEKKQLIIYIIVAYGITYLMGILMWYANSRGIDVSAFPNAQMMYPAAGVMLAYLITKKDDDKLPKLFYYIVIFFTVVLIVVSILSIIMPDELLILAGTAIPVWTMIIQFGIIIGSIACIISYFVTKKEKIEAYGLKWQNWKQTLFCIILFLLLYFGRIIFSCLLAGQVGEFANMMASPNAWILIAVLPINFFFVFIAFLGEEYGWRYYLQPILQKKFGLRMGVIVLGVVWGLWHLPVDFFYYSPGNGLVAAVAQQITCITLGIFFAYAYMKTNNIWVVVILHYLNNNLVPIIAGNYSADVLQNQSIAWSNLPITLLVNALFFGIFIFSKVFRGNSDSKNVQS